MNSTQTIYGVSSLKECLVRFGLWAVTLIVGLACGLVSSYGAFYVTVLVQSLNSFYDAAGYLGGYSRAVTVANIISAIGNVLTFICSVLYFTELGTYFAKTWVVVIINVVLSIPVIIACVQMILLIKNNRY